MRFYGLGLGEVRNMDSEDEEMLWQAITVIEAQDALVQIKNNSFHRMKRNEQERYHRRLHRKAYPDDYAEPVTVTPQSIARIVNG